MSVNQMKTDSSSDRLTQITQIKNENGTITADFTDLRGLF